MPLRGALLARLLAWSAGGAFVASLAYFAWSYVVRFDHLRPGGPVRAITIDLALFGAFALHHSLLARDRVKAQIGVVLPSWLARSAYVWIASILFFVVCREWQPVAGVLYWHTGTAAVLHRVVQAAGVLVVAAAARAVGPFNLAGISPSPSPPGRRERTSAGMPDAHRDSPPAVVRRGPYRLVRHPIYLGWMLAVFGSPHMNGARLSFAVISCAYLLLAMPWEERSLLASHGTEYSRYLARVRWRLIPRVY